MALLWAGLICIGAVQFAGSGATHDDSHSPDNGADAIDVGDALNAIGLP